MQQTDSNAMHPVVPFPVIDIIARRAYCVETSKFSMCVRPSSSVRHAHRIGTRFSDKKLPNRFTGQMYRTQNWTIS